MTESLSSAGTFCWQFPDPDAPIHEHYREHCPVLKELASINPAIFPVTKNVVNWRTEVNCATDPNHTSSVLGKRAITATGTDTLDPEEFRRRRKP